MTKINFEVCPNCKENFKVDGIAYVENGCTNYLNYKKVGKEWIIDYETNGDNSSETYYICRGCQKQLPPDYQEYFGDNL